MKKRPSSDLSMPRRDFLKHSVVTAGALGAVGGIEPRSAQAAESMGAAPARAKTSKPGTDPGSHDYNTYYTGEHLSRVAFPMGGMGAGMICLEGSGALSHVSLRHRPEVFNEPCTFAAVCVKGAGKDGNVARLIEGPIPSWKIFGLPNSGNGLKGADLGLPRFGEASFKARFPFGKVSLADKAIPLKADITGWSPFEPNDADSASLPVAGLEYRLTNTAKHTIEGVFSFNAKNILGSDPRRHMIESCPGGFVFVDQGTDETPWEKAAFVVAATDPATKANCGWFRGSWYDAMTVAWKDIQEGACFDRPPYTSGNPAPGATLFVPFKLSAGQTKTIVLELSWFVGQSDFRVGKDPDDLQVEKNTKFTPWYAGRFNNVGDVADYWRKNYDRLRQNSKRFSKAFHDTTLPPEVVEAVAANLTILKSPTVLRQSDGRLWCFEGCCDSRGCCHGSCTHVWNYAQAIPHLFPALERTLRETEYFVSQDDRGHQAFRTALPIRPTKHDFHAASDGQLGGVMKAYREWRISGDTNWLRRLWPKIKQSMAYCIQTWDPRHKGVLEEPHHNTYDIEFWGPDGMCSSFYLGALKAMTLMGKALGEDVSYYADLLAKGKEFLETKLYDGEYFFQKIQWEGLEAKSPIATGKGSPEELALMRKEGPKYQYGTGCISDGVLGCWIAEVSGVGEVLDSTKVTSHLMAVHKHNLKHSLAAHANPQRPTFACGNEGGLLLCTWPKGGALTLPFVYSNEVWTGIEYQVAAHLMTMGKVDEGLEIVRVCRDRYDGRVRNPFNEYECGHWYARAMASYGMIQGLTGVRYDAVDKTLTIEPTLKGDFRSFLSTASGYGTVGVKDGKPFVDIVDGTLDVQHIKYTPKA